MLSCDPTYLGIIAAVSGAALNVHLAESVASGLSIFKGQTYKVGQVGSFVRAPQDYEDLVGVASKAGNKNVLRPLGVIHQRYHAIPCIGDRLGAHQNPLQNSLEVQAFVDAQAGCSQPEQTVPQGLDLLIERCRIGQTLTHWFRPAAP